jgi:hypothetical protein
LLPIGCDPPVSSLVARLLPKDFIARCLT